MNTKKKLKLESAPLGKHFSGNRAVQAVRWARAVSACSTRKGKAKSNISYMQGGLLVAQWQDDVLRNPAIRGRRYHVQCRSANSGRLVMALFGPEVEQRLANCWRVERKARQGHLVKLCFRNGLLRDRAKNSGVQN